MFITVSRLFTASHTHAMADKTTGAPRQSGWRGWGAPAVHAIFNFDGVLLQPGRTVKDGD